MRNGNCVGGITQGSYRPRKRSPRAVTLLVNRYSNTGTRYKSVILLGVERIYLWAVEKFSGISSIGDGYQINFERDTSLRTQQDPALLDKLQVRVLKRMKDVYLTTGLAAVWQIINQLKLLTGGLASSAPSFADWSVREVLALAKLPAQSLRSFAAFMVRTQSFDTPYTDSFPSVAVSLRQLLTNVPH